MSNQIQQPQRAIENILYAVDRIDENLKLLVDWMAANSGKGYISISDLHFEVRRIRGTIQNLQHSINNPKP